jgi:hypothetical protein|tara:strand:+ start:145 stop:420 length:276 start_codon:yes stop_codon:yes gene_type:complete
MVKKISSIIVGDKEYFKYLIVWEDIVGDSSITDFNEFSKMSVATINTEAYIFKKTDKYVYSFASYQNDNGEVSFGDRNVYPRSVIKKMIRI